MRSKLLFLVMLFFSATNFSSAQERSKAKFGNVTSEDFKHTRYAIDSNATAVVIADIGSTEIVGNNKGGFSLLFKHYRRAHILNKNGYDIATVEIDLLTMGEREEELENLKAVTYNLENGKVVETKLDLRSGVFKDKIDKNYIRKKFTLPNLKEGSIIEYEYKIQSDFTFNLQPWNFQGEHPRIWSEYNVAIPNFYSYVTLSQGYHPFAIKDQKFSQGNFQLTDIRGTGSTARTNFNAEVVDHRWVMKEVPALKEESFTSTLRNHVSRLSFQLSSRSYPFQPQQVMSTWEAAIKSLLEREDFGAFLNKDNGWLNDAMKEAVNKDGTNLQKAHSIYGWVRDHFTCTDHSAVIMNDNIRNVLKKRNGNVSEINLLMTAMLRKAGIAAAPVILSTRSNGFTNSIYPLMDRFNYVITRIEDNGKEYFLDASEPAMGFGKLNFQCYNGHARIVTEAATAIELNSDDLKEEKTTSVFIINDDKGNSIGSIQQTTGYYESGIIREKIKEKGKEQFITDLKKELGESIKVINPRIDSLDKYEEPVGLSFDIDLVGEKENIIYFNPMFHEGFKENPFKSAQRFYPVEMPYTIDQTFNLQMQVPAGYVVDELPKQTVVKLNDNDDALFEYRLSQSGESISFRSRLQIKKAYFQPDEYEMLREFFNLVVKKHNEHIVFKKKTNP